MNYYYIIVFFFFLLLLNELRTQKKAIDGQNLKLIQFYLNKQLATQLLGLLTTKPDVKEVIEIIYAYYQLNNLIVYDLKEAKTTTSAHKNLVSKDAENYIRLNQESISVKLSNEDQKIIKENFLTEKVSYNLYITKKGRFFICFIKESSSQLLDHDLRFLSPCIRDIVFLSV